MYMCAWFMRLSLHLSLDGEGSGLINALLIAGEDAVVIHDLVCLFDVGAHAFCTLILLAYRYSFPYPLPFPPLLNCIHIYD
jgi:hypothetical protein